MWSSSPIDDSAGAAMDELRGERKAKPDMRSDVWNPSRRQFSGRGGQNTEATNRPFLPFAPVFWVFWVIGAIPGDGEAFGV